MKRHGNLFPKIVDSNNLYQAWLKAKRHKSSYKAVQKFAENVENNLDKIRDSLLFRTFTTAKYQSKIVYEPKKRTIYVLPFYPDRIVQHALMLVLSPILTPMFIYDSYACIENKGQQAGSRRTTEFVKRNRYCLKCDVRHFYESVVHDILYEMIEHKIKCPDTLWLIRDILYSFPDGRNVPIGNLTSQWFGNFYLSALDSYVKNTLHIKDYLRYCDDFIMFDNDKAKLRECSYYIKGFLHDRLQLSLSKCDLFPVKRGVDFLGYRHFPDYVLVRKSTAKRIKKRLKFLLGNLSKKIVTLDTARSILASAKGWLQWANSYNFRESLRFNTLTDRIAA